MRDINKVILLGRLGADPIRRTTKIGTSVVHFSVATKRRFLRESSGSASELVVDSVSALPGYSESVMATDSISAVAGFPASVAATDSISAVASDPVSVGSASGTAVKGEETQWHKIVSWGKLGENCAQYLKKGNSVYVEGTLRTHSYNDKAGTQKWSTEVYAETISFLDGARSIRP